MPQEAWTLVGVAIGALLGGGAQILAALMRDKHERRRWLDDHRRAAYLSMIQASDALAQVMRNDRDRGLIDDDDPAGLPETRQGLHDFRAALDGVEFYGSETIIRACDDLQVQLWGPAMMARGDDDRTFYDELRGADEVRKRLSQAMRKELGISG